MKLFLKTVFFIFFGSVLVYVSLPNPVFPEALPGSLQSQEKGDSEDLTHRRAYFTNMTREEVMNHYVNVFKGFRLNYPPEEAKKIIRDQTRSTFLEEVVHPLRESIFINGFEPADPKDTITIDNHVWRQKITVRYYPSNFLFRLFIAVSSGIAAFFLGKEVVRW